MTIDEIKEIIHILHESGVAEIEVQRGDNRVWIKRSVNPEVHQVAVPVAMPIAATASLASPSTPVAPEPSAHPPAANETLPTVKAPIVGTFYESPSPGSAAFVKVGDTVQPGQVLCIIESMKLMNEIEAEAPGIIVAKLVPN